MAGAPEKHRAPLPPVAPARGSLPSAKQEAAAQQQRQAPALQSTKVMDAALQVTTRRRERKPLGQSVALVQRKNQQRVEQKDRVRSVDVAMAASSHAQPKDVESPMAAGPQGQPSKAPLVPAASEAGKEVVSPMSHDNQEEAITTRVSPAAHEGVSPAPAAHESVSPAPAAHMDTEPAAPTLSGAAEEEQHGPPHAAVSQQEEEALAPASHGFDEQESEEEAQRKAFDLLSPTASELIIQQTASRIARDVLREALAVIQKRNEQPQEQQDKAKSMGVSMATMLPAAVEDTESPVAAEPKEEPSMDKQQTPAQAPAPRRLTLTETAVQVLFWRKVRRGPGKHQGEASTAVTSPSLRKDEPAASPASVEDSKHEPATSLSRVAPKQGRQQRVHEFSHAPASPPWARAESPW